MGNAIVNFRDIEERRGCRRGRKSGIRKSFQQKERVEWGGTGVTRQCRESQK
jgi:hypothetical protein